MDLNEELKIASDKVIKEKLPAMVETKVESMINEILEDTFRSYGDVAKSIKEQIQKKIDVNLERYDMVDYNVLIAETINKSLISSVNEGCVKPIEGMIKDIVGFVNKKEINISDIALMVIESAREDSCDDEGEISFHINKSERHDWHTISFDFEPDQTESECDHEFLVSSSRDDIFIFRTKTNWDRKGIITPQRMVNIRSIEAKIFRLYAAQTKVIIDTNSVDCYWNKYEY